MLETKETLYVVKIFNRDSIPLHYWYGKKSGEIHVCRYDKELEKYLTCNDIKGDSTHGWIDEEHAKVLTEFEYDE